jgi:hypothetical protein
MPDPSDPYPQILAEINAKRALADEAQQYFTSVPEQQLRQRPTPQIVWQSWNPTARAGTRLIYSAGIANPQRSPSTSTFLYVFVGPGNLRSDNRDGSPGVGLGIRETFSAIDPRFPRLTMPPFDAPPIESGQTRSVSFVMPIAADVEAGNYIGGALLLQAVWHGGGAFIDSSIFVFQVT